MNKKISNMLSRFPMCLMCILAIMSSTAIGIVISKINLMESKISQLFTVETLINLFLLYVLTHVLEIFLKVFQKGFSMKVTNNCYLKYFDRISKSSIADIQRVSTGKIFDAVNDISKHTGDIFSEMITIMPTIVPFGVLIYKLGKVSIISALITVVDIIVSLVMIMMTDKMFSFDTEAKKYKAKLSGVTVDNFMNIKTLKYLGKFSFGYSRLKNQQQETYPYFVNSGKILFWRLIDIVMITPLIINIYISRGDTNMIAFILLSNYTIDNTTGYLCNIADLIIERNAALSVIKDIDGSDMEKPKSMPDVLKLHNMGFNYGKDSTHFYIEDLEFRKGERYHVTGESGQGKSSLANLIVGAIKPTNGKIDKIKTFYVYQETECFDDTLRNNIKFYDDSISDLEILKLFDECNMLDWYYSLKDGLDTVMGERGFKLSSGQKQRINIIRAILRMREMNDEFIILDEITSNLDTETEKLAIDLIDKNCKGTLMVISHHGDFANICRNHIEVVEHKFIQAKS